MTYCSQIKKEDEEAFCAGVYYHSYETLGAHPMEMDGVAGTNFAVWAPNANRVSVVGTFNGWDGQMHAMYRKPMSGIYELFVPGAAAGDAYQYEVTQANGRVVRKADPYSFSQSAADPLLSVIVQDEPYPWSDEDWCGRRAQDAQAPMVIYEADLSEWESVEALVEFAGQLHYTHVELHPVMEYTDEESKGYSTFSYYAVATRFGGAKRFCRLVDALHQAGIGVILDWTPAHFPRGEAGLERFDGTPLYEVPDPFMALHPMWNTYLFQYASPMVCDFLIGNAFWWIEKFHVDALRLDDVDPMLYLDYGRGPGQWKANFFGTNENLDAVEFLKHLNSIIKKRIPGIQILAQEDGYWPQVTDSVENDHLGFDYKWNNNWTGEIVRYMKLPMSERTRYFDRLTFPMLYAYCEQYVLTLGRRDVGTWKSLCESLPGTAVEQSAQARLLYTYQMLHPGAVMTAPEREIAGTIKDFFLDLNKVYQDKPAFYEWDDDCEGMEWIRCMKNPQNILAFLRKNDDPEDTVLAVLNFGSQAIENCRIGVPMEGVYEEIFNTDRERYGGSGMVNPLPRTSEAQRTDARDHSIEIRLPAMSAVVLQYKK